MHHRSLLFLLSCSMLLAPLANAEDLIEGKDPFEVLAVARDFGEANLSRDEFGDPMIAGFLGDLFYGVVFYGCSEALQCEDIQIVSYLSFEEAPSLERVNEWNRDYRIGTLALDGEGDLEFFVTIVLKGGITRTNLSNLFREFSFTYMLLEREFPEGTPMRADG